VSSEAVRLGSEIVLGGASVFPRGLFIYPIVDGNQKFAIKARICLFFVFVTVFFAPLTGSDLHIPDMAENLKLEEYVCDYMVRKKGSKKGSVLSYCHFDLLGKFLNV